MTTDMWQAIGVVTGIGVLVVTALIWRVYVWQGRTMERQAAAQEEANRIARENLQRQEARHPKEFDALIHLLEQDYQKFKQKLHPQSSQTARGGLQPFIEQVKLKTQELGDPLVRQKSEEILKPFVALDGNLPTFETYCGVLENVIERLKELRP